MSSFILPCECLNYHILFLSQATRLVGLNFSAALVVIIAGVQLSTPHRLVATAIAVTTSARAVGDTVFTAIFSAAHTSELGVKLPADIGSAVTKASLAADHVSSFINALTTSDTAAPAIPGVNSIIVDAAMEAMKQAYAYSLHFVYYIAIPFAVVACLACFFLDELGTTMGQKEHQ